MLFSVSTIRRAAVVLAVGCATALTATAASAVPTSPVHSARPTVTPTCARANLKLHVSQGSGAAGTITYLLRFTNTSHRTCYLFGFPGVAAVNWHGRRLCRPAMARGLRVIPPSRVAPGFARLRFLACSRAGTTYLRVQRIQPGRGHL
jgi:hypothetical protein